MKSEGGAPPGTPRNTPLAESKSRPEVEGLEGLGAQAMGTSSDQRVPA